MLQFYIILVKTDSSDNAGSIARLMGNYDIKNLIFISPLWKDIEKVLYVAHTKSGIEIINKSKTFKTLNDAVEKLKLNSLIGFTRRAGKYREISGNYRSYFKDYFRNIYFRKTKIGLVFGSEEKGLDDEDIKSCSNLLYIPTSNISPSLNLSHAVGVVLNEVFYYLNKQKNNFSNLSLDVENIFKAASAVERKKFIKEIIQISKMKKLFIKNDEKTFIRLFERIFTSPIITKKDLNLLKRVLTRFIYADKIHK
jgi:TrmH family RNA methyltransferase